MVSPTPRSQNSVLIKLPQELIEQTIIWCAVGQFPVAISALAQTCRFFTFLIYRTPDHHLWREIFLTTFDDPRPALAALHEASLGGPPFHSDILSKGLFPFEWRQEFQSRIHASAYISRQTRALYVGQDDYMDMDDQKDLLTLDSPKFASEPLLRTMMALISVIETSAVYPQLNAFLDDKPVSFPHIVILRSTEGIPDTLVSRNARWLEAVLKDGFPLALSRMMFLRFGPRSTKTLSTRALASDDGESTTSVATTTVPPSEYEGRQTNWSHWEGSLEGQLFYKLVYLVGFIPNPSGIIRPFVEPDPPEQEGNLLDDLLHTPNPARGGMKTRSQRKAFVDHTIPSDDRQIAEARGRARVIVYDMNYLRRQRLWGPFLPLRLNSNEDTVMGSPSDMTNESPHASFLEAGGPGIQDIDDDDDLDYFPGNEERNSEGSDDDDTDSNEGFDPPVDLPFLLGNPPVLDPMHQEPHPTFVFPDRPDLVIPDYSFLAAARLLVERNLRELLVDADDGQTQADGSANEAGNLGKVVEALHSLELLRMGGVPRFWRDSWIHPEAKRLREEEAARLDAAMTQLNNPFASSKIDANGKGKARQPEEYAGWDWAGVEGEWRRCVCWMDYRDLVLHNLSAFSRKVEETIRMFPLTFRVSHYSPPPPCPLDADPTDLCWRLPIIHITGEGRGSEWDPQIKRTVKGTVRMIGDGAVRWSMTSSYPNAEENEWSTEGVQVGSIGSAIGFIGLWTGADHAQADPLGPCWAWKVA
ncbi:hypothetical protein DL96DRAFT_1600622 [Flagelloscypha sp. PMI_526]|nr:hypothetical protein DL96DRAFT_1600622 [Flagelloscypha sp. PMI_526]